MNRFENKVVVISGGSTGIGFRTAQFLAQEGARVVIAGQNLENGMKAQKQLNDNGGKHLYVQADISQESDVKALIDRTMEQMGQIDVLVNNAAMFYESDFLTESTEKWHRVFDVIVDGAYLCSKYAANAIISSSKQGTIVNISSINGSRALQYSSHYNAAKGALDQLTRCTALELAPYNIRVNGVSPGFIDTELSIVSGINELETEEFKSYYMKMRKIPMARAGRTDEIANVIAFLASEQSSYINGAIIPVDGGLSITF
jgi:meso-butanediol dehydrogenase/(S,S)-butanediol dehydrogenase/diacetyl reductase